MQLSVTSSIFKYNYSNLLKNYFLPLKCFLVEISLTPQVMGIFCPFMKTSLFKQPCGCCYLWIEITVSLHHTDHCFEDLNGVSKIPRQFKQRFSPHFTPNLPMVGVNGGIFMAIPNLPFRVILSNSNQRVNLETHSNLQHTDGLRRSSAT